MLREIDEETRLVAFLAALCLFMSTIEYAIPKPVPFFRIGLANAPMLLAVRKLSPGKMLLLAALKALGQGLISGTFLSYVFLFSLAGTFSSCLTMIAVAAIGGSRVTRIGISVSSGLVSNIAQLVLARYILFGSGIGYLTPLILGIGTASSVFLGYVSELFIRESRWYALLPEFRR
ncbi:hypothetical protein MASR2M48_33650 [Spirochaetota bacterium]|jgi:heptaprenyl diphosphate synthase